MCVYLFNVIITIVGNITQRKRYPRQHGRMDEEQSPVAHVPVRHVEPREHQIPDGSDGRVDDKESSVKM